MTTTEATPGASAPVTAHAAHAAFEPSTYQRAIFDFIQHGDGDGIVSAVAGSGKSTTIIQAAKLIPAWQDGLFVAFNKHIADALAAKLRGTSMTAKTIHSIGMGVVQKHLGGKVQIEGNKYRKLAREAVWRDIVPVPGPNQATATQALVKLADLARLTLTPPHDTDRLRALMEHFGVECPDANIEREVLAALPGVLRGGQRIAESQKLIDFTDMLYLPFVWELTPPQVQWVFLDECQDLNRAQLELVLACRAPGGRLLAVGDPRQSIMGFAGADSDSFWAIQHRTNATLLPLSICYRCPSSHLDLAREFVPEIEARPGAPAGVIEDVLDGSLADTIREGDMVLCRLTAPLIETCIRLIERKIPARVRGRDIGKQLTDMVRAVTLLSDYSWSRFAECLDVYAQQQVTKLAQREHTEAQIESLYDRVSAVQSCYRWREFTSADEFCRELEALFSDDHPAVLLSTIHRAKGLENARVFILKPEKLPLFWPKQQAWEAEQEENIYYVALTRATDALYFIR